VHPLRALALFVALPLAAWSAAHGPHDSVRLHAVTTAMSEAPRASAVAPVARAAPIARPRPRPHPTDFKLLAQQLLYVANLHALQQRIAVWDELAHCESGGNWNVVDRYGGGLGIYIGTWQMFNGDEFASNPGYASKVQQIIVAERIYARFGFSGWGCAHELGWVR
jgi:hypothetical protein